MKGYDLYCGLDVGKSFHFACVIDSVGTITTERRVEQREEDLISLFTALSHEGSTLIIVDQPKNIGLLAIRCARASECEVAYLPGLAMRHAAGMFPGDAKTDRRDAFIIAKTALAIPDALLPISEDVERREKVCTLAGHDDDLAHDRTRSINRLRAALVEDHPAFEAACGSRLTSAFTLRLLEHYGGPWRIKHAGRSRVEKWSAKNGRVPKGLIDAIFSALGSMQLRPVNSEIIENHVLPDLVESIIRLDKRRKGIKDEIESLLADDATFVCLMSIPGVGIKTAATIYTCVDIDLFDSADQLASYAGLSPKTRQSGTSIRGESAPRSGNKALKNALYLSAGVAILSDPIARDYYERKRSEGKSHKAAVICLAKRRCKIIYAIMRKQEPYIVRTIA